MDAASRPLLTRDRIVHAAVAVADCGGLGALTMRRLGTELGVEAMSLYKHVAGKDEILDGVVDLIVGQIEIPTEAAGWREAMRRRAESAREVLGRHSWAIGLLETRGATGPASLRYVDSVLGILRSAGFSVENAAHAFWLLDSYVYGHIVQETSFAPDGPATGTAASTASDLEQAVTGDYPHLAEMGAHATRIGFSIDVEFAFGLDLILDALDRLAATASGDVGPGAREPGPGQAR
jgi:AcrR family transcriptional regulator